MRRSWGLGPCCDPEYTAGSLTLEQPRALDRIEPVVARQGQSLTLLEWRYEERFDDREVALLSPVSVRRPRALTPGLSELTIDLQSHGAAWPWTELDALRRRRRPGSRTGLRT